MGEKLGGTPEGTRSLTFRVVQPWFGGLFYVNEIPHLEGDGENPVHRKGLDGRFAPVGQIGWMPPVFELVAAICRWRGVF